MRHTADPPFVQEMGRCGPYLYIRIRTPGERPMGWEEIWAVFADRYPGKWAMQFFPPGNRLVNDANVYHLYVLPGDPPPGVDIHSRINGPAMPFCDWLNEGIGNDDRFE